VTVADPRAAYNGCSTPGTLNTQFLETAFIALGISGSHASQPPFTGVRGAVKSPLPAAPVTRLGWVAHRRGELMFGKSPAAEDDSVRETTTTWQTRSPFRRRAMRTVESSTMVRAEVSFR
jgi:hypothetical protein